MEQHHSESGDIVKISFLAGLVASAAIASAPAVASAQSYNPFQIGASAGLAVPAGNLGDAANLGYSVAVILGYSPAAFPFGLRFEGAYNEFGLKGSGGGKADISSATGNAVFNLPMSGLAVYGIGGAGLYHTGASVAGASGSENNFGFNIGAGLKFPLSRSFDTFVEARFHSVTADGGNLNFVPVTFGILF